MLRGRRLTYLEDLGETMSQLQDKLASLAVAVTVTFMFTCLAWLVPRIKHLPLPQAVGIYAITALGSVAIYKTIASSLLWSFKKSFLLRRFFLGKSFLEGSWVGHYKNNGQDRFTLEVIDQSGGLTKINGRELTCDGNTTATWVSDTVSMDTQRKRLVYAYSCDVFETNQATSSEVVYEMAISEDVAKRYRIRVIMCCRPY